MRPESARLTFREMTPDDLDDMALLLAEKIGLHPEKRAAVHGGRDAIIYAAALDQQ